jgi:glycolate oxidase FAD binding subunit
MTAGPIPAALTDACAAVRPAGPADAVAGVAPSFVAVPASLAECSAVLHAAAAARLTVSFRGAGTHLAWGDPPSRCDLVVATTAMNRVLEHAAGDLIATVQAGVTLGDLRPLLAAAGQRLALDPPSGSRAAARTVGGVIATAAAGPLRLRYGTPRDLLIGITVVRADGTVARAGGKVVKNVAGYDLGKLFAGSYGTLGLVAEATFRLHPLPAATAWVTMDCADAQAAAAAMRAAVQSPLSPSAAEISRPRRGVPLRTAVLVEGTAEGVAERAGRMRDLLGPAASLVPEPPWWGRMPQAVAGRAAGPSGAPETLVRIAFWPGALADVLGSIDAAASAAGLDVAVGGSAAGVLHAAITAEASPPDVAAFVTRLRGLVSGAGSGDGSSAVPAGAGPPARGSVVVLSAPGPVRAAVDCWGPMPGAKLMRAVKEQFDPEHRLAPGRLAGVA